MASYDFNIGNVRGLVVSNGRGEVDTQQFSAPDAVVLNAYKKCFRSTMPFFYAQNIVVLDMPSGKRVMFDTGSKPNPIFPFWAKTGMLLPNLQAAGIAPSSIDAIVLTHGHADHVNGLVLDDGNAAFPNADVYIGRVEHDFWTAPTANPSARISPETFGKLYNHTTQIQERARQRPNLLHLFFSGSFESLLHEHRSVRSAF